MMTKNFKTFDEFYRFYLTQHQHAGTRMMHFAGTLVILTAVIYVLLTAKSRFLWYIPILGFGLQWLSHFMFEGNKPVMMRYFFREVMADFRMFWELLSRKQHFRSQKNPA